MIRSVAQFGKKDTSKFTYSDREISESYLRVFYEMNTGHDVDEELMRYQVAAGKVTAMFDDLHERFGQGLVTKNREVGSRTFPEAALALVRHLDVFRHESDLKFIRQNQF